MELRKGKHHLRPFHYLMLISKILFLCSIMLFCLLSIKHFRLSQCFPIKTVRVYGVSRLDPKDVQELLTPLVIHGFFNTKVELIRERLLQQPWVADIFVRRNWPDQVEVTIVEKTAVARWDRQTLLSANGVLFNPRLETLPSHLPTFYGPNGQHIIMLNYFNEINRILLPLRAKISYLELTPYRTWKVTLDNGIVLQIGHKDILARLGQFVKVYPKIVGNRATEVDSIDLRYSNGVAVRWKVPVKIKL